MSDSENIQDYDSSDQEQSEHYEYQHSEPELLEGNQEQVEYDDSDDDIQQKIEEEKENLIANDTWGQSKYDFYGRDKEADDVSSSDDADELDEAKRLQAIRAKKINKQQQYAIEESESASSQSEAEEEADEKPSEQEDTDSDSGAFGDKLFGARIGKQGDNKAKLLTLKIEKLKEIRELVDDMKEVIASLDYEIEFPEDEELDSCAMISFTKQIILFIKKYACKRDKTLVKRNKRLFDFLKVKEQIVLNYCLYMNYYLLGQAKILSDSGKAINLQENEVLKKLTYYRTLIKQIEPIDAQIKEQLQAVEVDHPEDSEGEGEIEGELDEEVELDEEAEKQEQDSFEAFVEEDMEIQPDQDSEKQKLSKNSDEAVDLDNDADKWEEDDQQDNMNEDGPADAYESIENMLHFGTSDPKQATHSKEDGETEVKEVNKILDKVIKKKKLVNKRTQERANVDDLVSEEDEPKKKKAKLKKRVKLAKTVEGDIEDNLNFGGVGIDKEQDLDDKEDQAEQQKLEEIKAKKRELKEQKKKERMENIETTRKHEQEKIVHNSNRSIMKGKGLYRKRPKAYRNPRIKHKMKYQKALTKRKRMVQEYKEGPQAKYAGELTGIRSNLIKSTKL